MTAWGDGVVPSYDAIADEYAKDYFDELDGKPFDRDVLDRFALSLKPRGRVCDLGCRPGQIARYLASGGVDVMGIDASAGMIATARRLNPGIEFHEGSFFSLPLLDGVLAGVAAFYSLIHCARPELPRAVAEIFRVIQPGGRFLMTVHVGTGEVGRDDFHGTPVKLVATLFAEDEVRAALTGAGFHIDGIVTRPPYPAEYQSTRIYATATRP
jgi:SAM-dependent methyltransferase